MSHFQIHRGDGDMLAFWFAGMQNKTSKKEKQKQKKEGKEEGKKMQECDSDPKPTLPWPCLEDQHYPRDYECPWAAAVLGCAGGAGTLLVRICGLWLTTRLQDALYVGQMLHWKCLLLCVVGFFVFFFLNAIIKQGNNMTRCSARDCWIHQ